jgi:tight adherence protein C
MPETLGRKGEETMLDGSMTALAAFAAASALVLLVFLVVGGRKDRLTARMQDLSGKPDPRASQEAVTRLTRSALPKLGAPLVPTDDDKRTRLQARLVHAGLYGRQVMVVFLGVKMLLIISPTFLGLVAGVLGMVTLVQGLLFGALCGIAGVIGPSFWLDRRKSNRQRAFRRALPDALDVVVICLEGGLSLQGAIRRMAVELRGVHPLLASELNIVQREVQLGRSTGEALRQFADRADLEELRSLASVITQSERFGASLVKVLRVHAETLRTKRLQQAEEMAAKASTKLLFPTVFLILPGVFVVILGPAVIQVAEMFSRMGW